MEQTRRRLPDVRQSITHKFCIGGCDGYIIVGMYEDGTPGEIFLKLAKEGSTLSGLFDCLAVSLSLALQYGVPLQALVDKFSHTRFEPSGMTCNPDIPFAKSIVDYIVRWLASKFLSKEDQRAVGVIQRDEPPVKEPKDFDTQFAPKSAPQAATVFKNDQDAPACTECGAIMVRNGACYKCLNCGSTSGCS
jgi:ribonucleoside-diphosphate reductase alpha chain